MQSLTEQGPLFRPQSAIEKLSRNSHTPQIAAKIARKILFLTEKGEKTIVEPVDEPMDKPIDEPMNKPMAELSPFFRVYSKK